MEQELRFGPDLGRLAVLRKRVWADYEQLLRVVFSCVLKSFIGEENFSIVSYSNRDPSLRDLSIITLGVGLEQGLQVSSTYF